MTLLYTEIVISSYGIILASVGVISIGWWYRRAVRVGITVSHIENILIVGLPLVVFGARVHHVLTDWSVYSSSPISVLHIWQGGLGLWGAITGGFIALLFYARSKRIDLHVLLSSIAPPVLLMVALGRWANIANNELVPFAYFESLGALVVLGIVMVFETKKRLSSYIWCIALGLYSSTRFVGEFLRGEPRIVIGLTVNQIVSLMALCVCCVILYRVLRAKRSFV